MKGVSLTAELVAVGIALILLYLVTGFQWTYWVLAWPVTLGVAALTRFGGRMLRSRSVTGRTIFAVGPYKLDDRLSDKSQLIEFTSEEYDGFQRQFYGEKIYHAPDVQFLERSWKLLIGCVGDQIYKLLPHQFFDDKVAAEVAAQQSLAFCTAQLGAPEESRPGFYIWDVHDGNVILENIEARQNSSVSIYLTSNEARRFQRLV